MIIEKSWNAFALWVLLTVLPSVAFADVYYADTNGDGVTDEINTYSDYFTIYHPNLGVYRYFYVGTSYSFFRTVDLDGTPGAEVVLHQGQFLHVFNDLTGSQRGYDIGATGIPMTTGQANGLAGEEIIGFTNQGLFVVDVIRGLVSEYGLQPDLPIFNPYLSVSMPKIADTNGNGGEEIVMLRSDNRVVNVDHTNGTVAVRDVSVTTPGWITTSNLYDIADTDGKAGGEVILWRNDNAVIVLSDINGYMGMNIYPQPGLFNFSGLADTDSVLGTEIILSRNDFVVSIIRDRTGGISNYHVIQAFDVEDIGGYDGGVGADVCYATVLSDPVYRYAIIDKSGTKILVSSCNAQNQPPVASAGSALSVSPGANVTLNAQASYDPDGRIVQYSWRQTAGPAATLRGVSIATPEFVMPIVSTTTTLTFEVMVEDNKGAGGIATVTVSVVAPGVPASLTVPATSASGNYNITWAAVSGTVTHYQLQEATDGGFTVPTVVYSGASLSSSLTGKNNGTYYYRVRACNGTVCSAYTTGTNGVVVIIPLPSMPSNITVPATSTGTHAVSWGAATGTVTHYELQEAIDSSFTAPTLGYLGPSLSGPITGKTSGTYYYRVRACNNTGCSNYITGSNGVVVIAPPGMPSSITVPATNNTGSYLISWGAATGIVANYELQESSNQNFRCGFNNNSCAVYIIPDLNYSISGKTDGTYYYRVRACNNVGCSNYRTGTNGLIVLRSGM